MISSADHAKNAVNLDVIGEDRPAYYKWAQRYFDEERCPFCEESYHERKMVLETKYWVVFLNDFPKEPHDQLQLLLVPRSKITTEFELTTEELVDRQHAIQLLREKYTVLEPGLVQVTREGRYSGATVNHLHTHIAEVRKEADPHIAYQACR